MNKYKRKHLIEKDIAKMLRRKAAKLENVFLNGSKAQLRTALVDSTLF